jgi:hypothetical protein
MRTDMHRIGLVRNMPCPINMPTGVHSILLALQMCEQVRSSHPLFNFILYYPLFHKTAEPNSQPDSLKANQPTTNGRAGTHCTDNIMIGGQT